MSLPVENKTVLVCYFETDRAPYVVRNPAGGHLTFEVPWRQGINTFSARRSQLLRLLAPLQKIPTVEFMQAWLIARLNREKGEQGGRPEELEWQHVFQMYVVPTSAQRIVIPKHHMDFYFEIPGTLPRVDFDVKSFEMDENSTFITYTRNEMVIDVAGTLTMRCYAYSEMPVSGLENDVQATYRMRLADCDRWVITNACLKSQQDKQGELGRWKLENGAGNDS